MSEPAVSVALATCNGERFLREQLDSIAHQSRLPAELVVSDDHSSDTTVGILHAFAHRAPFPVHIAVNSSRIGYARNFRSAAARCTGDLIAFSDQDDWWSRDKLDRLAAQFEDPRVMLAYHNARVVEPEPARGSVALRSQCRTGKDRHRAILALASFLRNDADVSRRTAAVRPILGTRA